MKNHPLLKGRNEYPVTQGRCQGGECSVFACWEVKPGNRQPRYTPVCRFRRGIRITLFWRFKGTKPFTNNSTLTPADGLAAHCGRRLK